MEKYAIYDHFERNMGLDEKAYDNSSHRYVYHIDKYHITKEIMQTKPAWWYN